MGEPKKNLSSEVLTMSGVFSKKEAANFIAKGEQHIHSTVLGDRDPCVALTRQSKNIAPLYPWEEKVENLYQVTASKPRHDQITSVLEKAGLTNRKVLCEKVRTTLEELLSNALYHAFQNSSGLEKYNRKDEVNLQKQELVQFAVTSTTNGAYIYVEDNGGNLKFSTLASAFARCYGDSSHQIESKDGGAGLGIYMVFEIVTHLKIVVSPGKRSVLSIWIADKRTHDRDLFSFNYFSEGENGD